MGISAHEEVSIPNPPERGLLRGRGATMTVQEVVSIPNPPERGLLPQHAIPRFSSYGYVSIPTLPKEGCYSSCRSARRFCTSCFNPQPSRKRVATNTTVPSSRSVRPVSIPNPPERGLLHFFIGPQTFYPEFQSPTLPKEGLLHRKQQPQAEQNQQFQSPTLPKEGCYDRPIALAIVRAGVSIPNPPERGLLPNIITGESFQRTGFNPQPSRKRVATPPLHGARFPADNRFNPQTLPKEGCYEKAPSSHDVTRSFNPQPSRKRVATVDFPRRRAARPARFGTSQPFETPRPRGKCHANLPREASSLPVRAHHDTRATACTETKLVPHQSFVSGNLVSSRYVNPTKVPHTRRPVQRPPRERPRAATTASTLPLPDHTPAPSDAPLPNP